MMNLDKYIDALIEHKLTQTQFLLMYLIYKRRLDLLLKYKEAFPSDNGGMLGSYLIKDLIDRGYIKIKTETAVSTLIARLQSTNDTTTSTLPDMSMAYITDKFLDIFIDKDNVMRDLMRLYPIQYHTVPVFGLKELYAKVIYDSEDEHGEILKDIEYAIKHKLNFVPLKEFIESKAWLIYRKQRLPLESNNNGSSGGFTRNLLEEWF